MGALYCRTLPAIELYNTPLRSLVLSQNVFTPFREPPQSPYSPIFIQGKASANRWRNNAQMPFFCELFQP